MNYKCKHCGSDKTRIETGKPPHLASLICAVCNRWIKWVSKKELALIELENNRQEDRADMLNLYGWHD